MSLSIPPLSIYTPSLSTDNTLGKRSISDISTLEEKKEEIPSDITAKVTTSLLQEEPQTQYKKRKLSHSSDFQQKKQDLIQKMQEQIKELKSEIKTLQENSVRIEEQTITIPYWGKSVKWVKSMKGDEILKEEIYDLSDTLLYKGKTLDGIPNGKGKLSLLGDSKFKNFKFKGTLANGLLVNGKGRGSDRKYIGDFNGGKFHGNGVLKFAHGDKYVGNFKNGHYHGQGILNYANGSKYDGNFQDGDFHGHGIATFKDGSSFEGAFEKGNLKKGIRKYSSGVLASYEGGFENKLYEGFGILTYSDGSMIKGIWNKGKLVGKAIHTKIDGSKLQETYDQYGNFIESIPYNDKDKH